MDIYDLQKAINGEMNKRFYCSLDPELGWNSDLIIQDAFFLSYSILPIGCDYLHTNLILILECNLLTVRSFKFWL